MYLIKIIKNYLSGRTFQVSLNNTTSIEKTVGAGSILGPILFNIFTSDIPPLPDGGVLSLFADDTAVAYKGRIIRPLVAKLQKGLDVLAEYFANWKVCINAAKTQPIIFPHSKFQRLVPPDDFRIRSGGATIDWSNGVVYLGMTLDSRLLFRAHTDNIKIKCNILIRSLYPLINRRSRLSLKNKLAVYRQVIFPVIAYAMPVWDCCANTHKQKLQVIQNKILKMILNLPPWTRTSEVHDLACIDPLNTAIEKHQSRFRTACLHSTIPEIRALAVE